MNHNLVRRFLYLERLLVAFASGLFLTLPLYFIKAGQSEVFFGKIYAIGALGTIFCVAFSAGIIKKIGVKNSAPIGSLLFSIGSLLYYLVSNFGLDPVIYYGASIFQGAGWGMVFTLGPICLSTTVENNNRSYYFTIYAAFSTLGVGLAPLVVRLIELIYPIQFKELFLAASSLSFSAALVSLYAAKKSETYSTAAAGSKVSGLYEFVQVIRQPCNYFIGMVFLGGCVYTSMMNLQTTFAAAQKIDYIVFYGFYSLAVVLSRFLLSKYLSKINPKKSIVGLMVMMVIAIALLIGANHSVFFYATGALLLGISYGLVYPLIQAEAANHAQPHLRPQTLIYFSLSYFLAVYLFPIIGALIAVSYGYEILLVVLAILAASELCLSIIFYSKRKLKDAGL
jgi:MFS family permease